MAAGLLDDYDITSLDDPSPLGRFFGREFGTVRREMLEAHPWYWAEKYAQLTETTVPAFGWRAAYQCPVDLLGVRRLYDPQNTTSDTPVPFRVVGDQIFTNVQGGINLTYTFDQKNVAKWRALAARAFAAKMAMYASQRVTGKAAYFEKCRTAYASSMQEATHSDALNRGMFEDVYTSGSDGFDSVSVRGGMYG